MTDKPPPSGPPPTRRPRSASPLRVGSPASLLAVVPALLGFHPDRSLVVLGAGPPGGRIQVTFRYDLPEPPDPAGCAAIAAHAARILARHQLPLAIVVGYGPGVMVTPVTDAVVAGLRRHEVALHDVLRVEHGRYWSYACTDPHCCPPEGVPFDASAHPAATALARAGNRALRDRAALAATIAPLTGLPAESMRQSIRRAERRAADLRRRAGAADVAEGLAAVSRILAVYRAGGHITDDDQLAWLAVSLADLRVRDDAWARLDPGPAQADHLRLWTDLVRRIPARYVPAPACLLAFTAWQSGNGALANIAAERALAADPDYSMATLLTDALAAGAPPSAARLPMTPDEVAASYGSPSAAQPTRPDPGRPAALEPGDSTAGAAAAPSPGAEPDRAASPPSAEPDAAAAPPRAAPQPGEAAPPRPDAGEAAPLEEADVDRAAPLAGTEPDRDARIRGAQPGETAPPEGADPDRAAPPRNAEPLRDVRIPGTQPGETAPPEGADPDRAAPPENAEPPRNARIPGTDPDGDALPESVPPEKGAPTRGAEAGAGTAGTGSARAARSEPAARPRPPALWLRRGSSAAQERPGQRNRAMPSPPRRRGAHRVSSRPPGAGFSGGADRAAR